MQSKNFEMISKNHVQYEKDPQKMLPPIDCANSLTNILFKTNIEKYLLLLSRVNVSTQSIKYGWVDN